MRTLTFLCLVAVTICAAGTVNAQDETLIITADLKHSEAASPATGDAYIFYGCGYGTNLSKPIIIVEGFDPSNEYNFYELATAINSTKLIDRLTAEGFDVILLNFGDGGDYVQNNAYLLVKLIDSINKLKVTSNELIVMGASMGGLVARYALSYMEQAPYINTHPLSHQTKLYISFDSPHRGAYIPLGIQHFVDFFASNSDEPAPEEGKRRLDTYAAQQMLVYHYSATSSNKAYPHSLRNGLITDPYFTMPQNLRRVAVANGSQMGNGIPGLGSCEKILSLTTAIYAEVVSFLGVTVLVHVDVTGAVWSVPSDPGGFCVIFEALIDPPTGFGDILDDISVEVVEQYDGAPGGTRNTMGEIAQETSGATTVHPAHSFIPTISALDLDSSITDLFFNISTADIVGNGLTSFHDYYAPSINNQAHTELNTVNSQWIYDQIVNPISNTRIGGVPINGVHFERATTISWTAVQVASTANVELYAEEEISLETGFEVAFGAEFLAITDPYCPPIFETQPIPPGGSASRMAGPGEEIGNVQLPLENRPDPKEESMMIGQNNLAVYPNPFKESATIEYTLAESGRVSILIHTIYGQEILKLVDSEYKESGTHQLTLDASNLAKGIYTCTIIASGFRQGQKMTIIK